MLTELLLHEQKLRNIDFSVFGTWDVWVSGLFCPDTQTPTCLTIRTFLSPDTKVGLGIRSPDTETPVYCTSYTKAKYTEVKIEHYLMLRFSPPKIS